MCIQTFDLVSSFQIYNWCNYYESHTIVDKLLFYIKINSGNFRETYRECVLDVLLAPLTSTHRFVSVRPVVLAIFFTLVGDVKAPLESPECYYLVSECYYQNAITLECYYSRMLLHCIGKST